MSRPFIHCRSNTQHMSKLTTQVDGLRTNVVTHTDSLQIILSLLQLSIKNTLSLVGSNPTNQPTHYINPEP